MPTDAVALARAAYHLGNRHIPVQVGAGWLAYEHDHVLDEMVAELGLAVETRSAPFEPEAGGYRHGAASGSTTDMTTNTSTGMRTNTDTSTAAPTVRRPTSSRSPASR